MNADERFVLDANVFIQAHRMHYAFDICPGFWAALIRQHRFGRLCSIDRVKNELSGEGDELARWIKKESPKGFFKGTADQQVVDVFRDMMNWVEAEAQFTRDAKAEFARVADGWLVAFAKVNGLTVVTHEEYSPQIRKSVKIPNVCIEFDVDYCDTFDMIRAVRELFVLKARRRSS